PQAAAGTDTFFAAMRRTWPVFQNGKCRRTPRKSCPSPFPANGRPLPRATRPLSPEHANGPEDGAQNQTEEQARRQWKVEAERLAFHATVARQPPKPGDRWRQDPDQANQGEHDDCEADIRLIIHQASPPPIDFLKSYQPWLQC